MPRYQQERGYGRYGYGMPSTGIDYIPRTDPSMTDRYAGLLSQRQERYDVYSQAIAEAMAKYGDVAAPMSDRDTVSQFIGQTDERLRDMVRTDYGGDYGIAGDEILREIARIRPTMAQISRDAEEEHRYRQIYDQLNVENKLAGRYNPETGLTDPVDPFSEPMYELVDGQLKTVSSRDYSDIRERSDYGRWAQENIIDRLSANVRSDIFGRISQVMAESRNVDRDMYYVDSKIQGFTKNEIRKMIDSGEILDDMTLSRFLDETSFGFERGMDLDTAKDYLANVISDRVIHQVSQSARVDEEERLRRSATQEAQDRPFPIGSLTHRVPSQLRDEGLTSVEQVRSAINAARRDGNEALARQLENNMALLQDQVLVHNSKYLETLERMPANQLIESLSHLEDGEAIGHELNDAIMNMMDSQSSTFRGLSESFSRRMGRWHNVARFISNPADVINKLARRERIADPKTIEDTQNRQAEKFILELARKNPEVADLLVEKIHTTGEIPTEGPGMAMATMYVPRSSLENRTSTSVVKDTEVTRALLPAMAHFAMYYNGEGDYEGMPSYKNYISELNRAMKRHETEQEMQVYRVDKGTHRTESRQSVSNYMDFWTEDPEHVTKKGEIENLDYFRGERLRSVSIAAGGEDNMPILYLTGTDDNGKVVEWRGNFKPKSYGFHTIHELSQYADNPEIYYQALGAVIPSVPFIDRGGTSLVEIIQHVENQTTGRVTPADDIKQIYGEAADFGITRTNVGYRLYNNKTGKAVGENFYDLKVYALMDLFDIVGIGDYESYILNNFNW